MSKKLNEFQAKLSNGSVIHIVHNIPKEGNINSVHAALDNWLARTKEHTSESFCNYINSKGLHTAITYEEYNNKGK